MLTDYKHFNKLPHAITTSSCPFWSFTAPQEPLYG